MCVSEFAMDTLGSVFETSVNKNGEVYFVVEKVAPFLKSSPKSKAGTNCSKDERLTDALLVQQLQCMATGIPLPMWTPRGLPQFFNTHGYNLRGVSMSGQVGWSLVVEKDVPKGVTLCSIAVEKVVGDFGWAMRHNGYGNTPYQSASNDQYVCLPPSVEHCGVLVNSADHSTSVNCKLLNVRMNKVGIKTVKRVRRGEHLLLFYMMSTRNNNVMNAMALRPARFITRMRKDKIRAQGGGATRKRYF